MIFEFIKNPEIYSEGNFYMNSKFNNEQHKYINSKYLEKNDYCFNLDLWNGDNNILYITGLSGSGKTTLGIDIQKNYNCYRIELDYISLYYMKKGDSNKIYKLLKQDCPGAEKFFDIYHHELVDKFKDTATIVSEFLKWFIPKVEGNGMLYVINGGQILSIIDPEYFSNKPIIIKEGNLFKSLNRRSNRESDGYYEYMKQYIHMLKNKDYRNAQRNMKKYAKDIYHYVNN